MACLLFLNILMVTRLGYLTREDPAPARYAWLICALQILSLALFAFQWPLVALGVVLAAGTALNQYLEHHRRHLAGTRAFTFIVFAVAGAALLDAVQLAPWSVALFDQLSSVTVWTASLSAGRWQAVNIVVFSLLVLTNEINLAIRYGFYRLNLEPGETSGTTDHSEYNAGRIIGILERYFVLVLLLGGADAAAIAIILAAKGFARFKQMDRREFAEYVLIGTLASTLAAVLVAALANRMLG